MKSAHTAFSENDTVGGAYKSSLFKSLFSDRKKLLEGFPAVKKGLAFPEPCLKFGGASYSFKTTDTVDKVTHKHADQEFTARYKKETGKFDLCTKFQPFAGIPSLYTLVKYEERASAQGPAYVFGLDYLRGSVAMNSKVNLFTGTLKASCLWNAEDLLRGLKVAADYKMLDALNGAGNGNYNLGFSYSSGAGLTALAYSGEKKVLTLNHSLQVDKSLSGILEAVVATQNNSAKSPSVCLGLAYQVDKCHQLRVRVNEKAQVSCCVKKDFSPNLSLLAATTVDLQGNGNKAGLAALMRPAMGFKVVTKV